MKRPWSTPVLEALQVPRPYVTKRDVIGFEILPALGEYAADHDVDAIADDAFVYVTATDRRGRRLVNRSGFIPRPDVDFWAAVAQHAL